MDKNIKVKLLIELIQASLEIDNLKPHVDNKQLEAANRIRQHLFTISELLKE